MRTACNTDKTLSSNQHYSDDAPNPRKPNHDAQELLCRQMQQAVLLYGSGKSHPSLQRIADELALNPIKVRKLLITAGVYKSDIAAQVNERFSTYEQEGVPHKDAIAFTAQDMQLSTSSVASYLPYSKCLYFPAETSADNLSTGAERQRRYIAVQRLRENPTEKTLWNCVVAFRNYPFTTLSGLPFTYDLKMGRHGKFTRSCGSPGARTAKVLPGVPQCWLSEILKKSVLKSNAPKHSAIYGAFRTFTRCSADLD